MNSMIVPILLSMFLIATAIIEVLVYRKIMAAEKNGVTLLGAKWLRAQGVRSVSVEGYTYTLEQALGQFGCVPAGSGFVFKDRYGKVVEV